MFEALSCIRSLSSSGSAEVMSLLSSCYSVLLDGMNAEVQIRWLQVIVRNSFYPDLHRVRSFLHKHVSSYGTEPSVSESPNTVWQEML